MKNPDGRKASEGKKKKKDAVLRVRTVKQNQLGWATGDRADLRFIRPLPCLIWEWIDGGSMAGVLLSLQPVRRASVQGAGRPWTPGLLLGGLDRQQLTSLCLAQERRDLGFEASGAVDLARLRPLVLLSIGGETRCDREPRFLLCRCLALLMGAHSQRTQVD